jgi:spermidine/putrescine-binding protein
MTENTPPHNRKAADRLHEIRERIRVLKAEESAIRQGLVDGSLDLDGDDYVAAVTTVVNERIYLRAMREHIPESVWKPFLISTPSVYVRTERKRAT